MYGTVAFCFSLVRRDGTRLFVLAVIEHATRGIRVLGATPDPAASRVIQADQTLRQTIDSESRAQAVNYATEDAPAAFKAFLEKSGTRPTLAGGKSGPGRPDRATSRDVARAASARVVSGRTDLYLPEVPS